MSENKMQESLANVIADGRSYKGFPVPYAPARAIWLDDFNSFLDRIEAATKREIDALQTQIENLKQQLPQPDPDWEKICEKCHDGEIEPQNCEYYGEPNGCNSPIFGQHTKTSGGDPSILRSALVNILLEMEDMCGIENGGKYKFSPDAIAQQCRNALALFTDSPENENTGADNVTAGKQELNANSKSAQIELRGEGSPRAKQGK